MMINPQTQNTVRTVFSGREESADRESHAINSSISGWVIKYKTFLLSRDISKDTRFRNDLVKDTPYKSVLCSPLYAEGIIIGTLLIVREDELVFDDKEMDYLNQFSTIVSPFMRNVQKIQHYFDHKISDTTLLDKYETVGLIGKCRKFIELLQGIETASKSDIRVLIEGESGTGKELVAKAIHQFSSRSQKKYVALDCGTIPDNLIESELFGHVKGAFTGATEHHSGLIQEANGGILFLDEIKNIPMVLQKKLLRFLQEGEIRPIGSSKSIRVNVRIVSASSQSLYQMVQQNKFREDLFYRLYVYPIKIPTLAERREDITVLAHYFLKKLSQQQNKKLKNLHKDIIDFIKRHTWRGNVRELENFIERIVTMSPQDASTIDPGSLPAEIKRNLEHPGPDGTALEKSQSLKEQMDRYEAELIRKTLIECDWNQSQAARKLKISETNIRFKINQLGLRRNEQA
jgi:transcriptional regulator with PAS, ATPase and Fis domain